MRASVIIPHLNTPDLLMRALASVAAQDFPDCEVIVADNGSRIPLDAVRAAWPEVRFLVEPRPGPGLARNAGIAAARSNTLLFLDSDCEAQPGWIAGCVEHVERHGERAVAGGRIDVSVRDPQRPSGVEAFEVVFAFNQRRYIERVGFSVTANLCMHRSVWEAVGPFGGIDEAEDLEWGKRAGRAGYRIAYLPHAAVTHPARPDGASLRAKWARLIAHEWGKHRRGGGGIWSWRAKSAAVALSVARDLPVVLASPKLPTMSARMRGAAFLFQTRWFRARDMLSVARPGAIAGSQGWNR